MRETDEYVLKLLEAERVMKVFINNEKARMGYENQTKQNIVTLLVTSFHNRSRQAWRRFDFGRFS